VTRHEHILISSEIKTGNSQLHGTVFIRYRKLSTYCMSYSLSIRTAVLHFLLQNWNYD